jgi:hypothetical protein
MNLRRYIQIKINVHGNTGSGTGNSNIRYKSQEILVNKEVKYCTVQHCNLHA